jgi:hypothetical protein
LPPKPPELPEPAEPTPLPALALEPPRTPDEVEPELRLAVVDDPLGADAILLPADEALTSPATEADLAVAALTRADVSAADLLVAATPPPVPEAWPETEVLADSSAVLRDAAWDDAMVDGVDPLGPGGAE